MSEREKEKIYAKAPTRFDFAGGSTDLKPFRDREGGYVVNAGIKQSAHAEIRKRNDSSIIFRSADYSKEESFPSLNDVTFDGPLRLIKATVKYMQPTEGVEVYTKVDVPLSSGLGSSAAVVIVLVGGLRAVNGEEIEKESIIHDAIYIENVMLGKVIGGRQDQYASALGGFHAFSFDGEEVTVKPLNISEDTISELEARSVLCYSGELHIAGTVNEQIMAEYTAGNPRTINALRDMKDLAHKVERSLVTGDVDEFGRLIQSVGETQKSFHPVVVPHVVEDIFVTARANGAIGGKLAGAGAGGYIYLFCENGRKQEVVDSLQLKHFSSMPLNFSSEGVTVWQS